ncbi:MAG: hypothetical protein IJR58_05055, partial [Lachnospiraceae bacterium]|nr:hypothetical protein [Lachnospiraceae bacterium]
AEKNGATLKRVVDESTPDITYILEHKAGSALIKLRVMNAISQVPKAAPWVNEQCIRRYGKAINWSVFLCYDRDDYRADITKFREGDWALLRKRIRKGVMIVDVAASADIEDIMLQDIEGVCAYLRIDVPVSLEGRRGKAKMKHLFRSCGNAYHEGARARELIRSLDMQKIMNTGVLPLKEIETAFFE